MAQNLGEHGLEFTTALCRDGEAMCNDGVMLRHCCVTLEGGAGGDAVGPLVLVGIWWRWSGSGLEQG